MLRKALRVRKISVLCSRRDIIVKKHFQFSCCSSSSSLFVLRNPGDSLHDVATRNDDFFAFPTRFVYRFSPPRISLSCTKQMILVCNVKYSEAASRAGGIANLLLYRSENDFFPTSQKLQFLRN